LIDVSLHWIQVLQKDELRYSIGVTQKKKTEQNITDAGEGSFLKYGKQII
jgi:hypothetical protein